MSQQQQSPDNPNAGKPVAAADSPPLELRQAQETLKSFREVPAELSIELGRGKMTLRDLLELRYHSIVELDKTAGTSLDVYVNGTLLAKGEPAIQEDQVGIKINEIVELERR